MCTAAAMASLPQCGARRISTRPLGWSIPIRCAFSSHSNLAVDINADCATTTGADSSSASGQSKNPSFFPKKGQTVELVCESLGFKGKGICKVADTGFVLMCDRALPGERFLGRVSRKKSSYAEVNYHSLILSELVFFSFIWLITVNTWVHSQVIGSICGICIHISVLWYREIFYLNYN